MNQGLTAHWGGTGGVCKEHAGCWLGLTTPEFWTRILIISCLYRQLRWVHWNHKHKRKRSKKERKREREGKKTDKLHKEHLLLTPDVKGTNYGQKHGISKQWACLQHHVSLCMNKIQTFSLLFIALEVQI